MIAGHSIADCGLRIADLPAVAGGRSARTAAPAPTQATATSPRNARPPAATSTDGQPSAPSPIRNPQSAIRNRVARSLPLFLALVVVLFLAGSAAAQARRLVVFKVDGLSQAQIDRFANERDPRTGKSLLPWFRHVFYERGTRLDNFYVRGMSLSGPSWSMLDTGQHLQIKGNVEFDRLTLHSYDYLNFIPFWLGHLGRVRVDMPGAELLDELGVPLLVDSYPYEERHTSFQLYQRGTRWTTLERGLKNRFTTRTPRELFDEWLTEFDARNILMEQLEREVVAKIGDPKIRYLDFYTTEFDHAAHHNRDRATHLAALQELDAALGRVWTAIERSPVASETALVLVSDHGTNTDERVYSQGFNLVKLLGSAAGGGHHVITKRRLLNDYAVKGFYPLVPLIYTTTEESYYLKGQSTDYPTALVDFDGNERAAVHLRDSDLNVLHALLLELQNRKLTGAARRAATDHFFATLERRRAGWRRLLEELREEVAALSRLVEKRRAVYESMPKQWTKADADAGRDQVARRLFAQLDSWETDVRKYTEYARTLSNLLALERATFDPSRLRAPDLVARGSMGESNTVHTLQNYVVGLAPQGLALAPDGTLDAARTFRRVDYLRLLSDVRVRNNVQAGVTNRPVDFVALRVPAELLSEAGGDDFRAEEAVWLYAGPDSQALILSRRRRGGELLLRYAPVSNLRQDERGRITFERAPLRPGLPLQIFEDARFAPPAGAARAEWLAGWHPDVDWLRALHLTRYSNGLVGLHEQFARHLTPAIDPDVPGLTEDERLIRRLRRRQRALVETDLLVLASDHWNFDVRGFNPGGNHGSFFRVSTHSALMFAGGDATGIPRGAVVSEPYDSLSFVPTILTLTGQLPRPGPTTPAALDAAAPRFPGRVITELFGARAPQSPATTAGTRTTSGAEDNP
jgi:arylsulfatase A-like enzyme